MAGQSGRRYHGPTVTVATVAVVAVVGTLAGAVGSMLGLGGGVFLVPFLVIGLGLPFQSAAGISLMTVIATSSTVSAQSAGQGLFNVRLGLVLEIATTLGGLAGGMTAAHLSQPVLSGLFAMVTALVALVTIARLDRRNVIHDAGSDLGRLGARIHDSDTGREVGYRVRRLPVALLISFAAGNVSGLLGIGGGILKVPALNAWCGVPMRAAAATSALMIGVTAVSTAPIYYARGDVDPALAAAAVLGVLGGSRAGMWATHQLRVRTLKIMMATVLIGVTLLMIGRAL